MKKEKHFPTIIGLILLVSTIFFSVYLSNRNTNPVTKASGSCDPINPQVTNITHKSASISFTTSSDCLSNISINGITYLSLKPKGQIHYFEINNLEEYKSYSYTIISDGKNFNSESNIFETAKKPTKEIINSNLAWGKILTPENNPATNAIIYLNIPGASPLSALVNSSGNWNISLATSFNKPPTDWFSVPNNIEEDIVVISPGYNPTQIVSNTSRNNPVPDIILGQNNFVLPQTTSNISKDNLLENDYSLKTNKQLDISNPKDNETLFTVRPDFFGTASPDSKIKITIESPVIINDETNVNNDGTWNWSPSKDLTPGEHTITVTDEDNNIISKKFIVLAAESSNLSFSASSSSTVKTPTPSKYITPTKTPTLKITSTPTKIVTKTPTIMPSKIPVINPSTASGIPKTGFMIPTFLLIFFSFIFSIFALIFYKKS